jgi:4-amino-4-deoxy-L-arabinose transferase-like glycosyltransferase
MLPYARMSARGRRVAGLLLLSIGLAVALTYPVAFRLDRVGRLNTGDGRWSIWCVAWVAHALTSAPSRLFDANIFHPHRNTLAYSENNIVAGILGAPAWIATRNAFATHNTAMLAGFVLSFLCTYGLARSLSGDTGLSIAAGIAFAYCPYVFARTAHIQLMMTFALPLALHMMHRLVDRPTAPRAIALGVALAIGALACGYYGIFAGLSVGLGVLLFAITRGLWRSPRYWMTVGLAALVSMIIVGPFFLPYITVRQEFGFERTIGDAAMYSANWQAWLTSSAIAHRWIHPLLGFRWNEVLFPGGLTLVSGLIGIWLVFRSPRSGPLAPAPDVPAPQRDVAAFYIIVAILVFWLSFGPAARLYTILFELLPAFSLLRAPARFAVLAPLSLVVLMAMGLAPLFARLRGAARLLAPTALSAGMTLELAVVPLAMPDVPPMHIAYRFLATARPGVVAEFPFFHARPDFPRHTSYMLLSTYHWMPLVNGYSDHIPEDFRKFAEPLSSFPTREAFAILRSRNTRYVVFHLDMYDQVLRRRLIERIERYKAYLQPMSQTSEVWLFEIVDWPQGP